MSQMGTAKADLGTRPGTRFRPFLFACRGLRITPSKTVTYPAGSILRRLSMTSKYAVHQGLIRP